MLINLDYGQPYGFETITVSSVSGGLTRLKYDIPGELPVKKSVIQVGTGGQIRYRIDGTGVVTGSVGFLMNPFNTLVLDGIVAVMNFSAIAVNSGTNGSISVCYFR